MEKNVKVDTYLTISKSSIKEFQKEANEEAMAQMGKDEGEDELYFPEIIWNAEELYFEREDNCLHLSGEFFHNGKKLGYLSPEIPLGNNTIIEIIEHRMKKLGKLKTVMEALKD